MNWLLLEAALSLSLTNRYIHTLTVIQTKLEPRQSNNSTQEGKSTIISPTLVHSAMSPATNNFDYLQDYQGPNI